MRSLKRWEKMVPNTGTDITKVRLEWVLSRHCIYPTSYNPSHVVIWPAKPYDGGASASQLVKYLPEM